MPGNLEQRCLEKGLKMTEQRKIIARVLSDATDHPDVEELYRRATAIDPGISIATIYRTVRLFEESGILDRHDFGDGRARYEETPDEHHDHLIDVETVSVSRKRWLAGDLTGRRSRAAVDDLAALAIERHHCSKSQFDTALKQMQITLNIARSNDPGETNDRWLPFKELYPDFGQPLL